MASVIQIVDGSEVDTRTIGQVFSTPGRARQWLTDSLLYTRLAAPDFLEPLLEDKLEFNTFYNDSLTNRLRAQSLEAVSPFDGLVSQGDVLVRQGEVISENVYQKLVSYRRLYNDNLQGSSSYLSVIGGYGILVGLVILLLFLYLRTFFPLVYVRPKNLVFILIWPLIYAVLVRSIELAPGVERIRGSLLHRADRDAHLLYGAARLFRPRGRGTHRELPHLPGLPVHLS